MPLLAEGLFVELPVDDGVGLVVGLSVVVLGFWLDPLFELAGLLDEVPVDGLLLVLPLTGFWVLDEPVPLLPELDVDAAGLLFELPLEPVFGFELVVPVGFEVLELGLLEVDLLGDAEL